MLPQLPSHIQRRSWRVQHVGRFATLLFLVLAALATSVVIGASGARAAGPTISVNKNITYQQVAGFGGFGAELPWYTGGPFYDQTFINNLVDDLGVSIVRDEIPPNFEQQQGVYNISTPSIDSCHGQSVPLQDHFAYLSALQAKANSSGVPLKLISSAWSPPAWMKYVNCVFGGDGNWNRLIVNEIPSAAVPNDYKQTYADYLVQYVKTMKQYTGIDVYAISIQNEPAFGESYPSAVYSPETLTNTMKVVVQDFKQNGLTTKIFMPEDVTDLGRLTSYVQWAEHDPVARQYIDIIAVHGYGPDGVTGAGSQSFWTSMGQMAQQSNTPLWMTETSGYTNDWNGGMSLAGSIYTAMKYGNASGWVWWALSDTSVNSYALMANGQPTSLYYASKQFYRYIRPGAVRIDAQSSDPDVLTVAFNDPANQTTSVVLINQNSTTAKTVSLGFQGSNIPANFTTYQSSSSQNAANVGTVASDGTLTLPAFSVTTLVGNNSGADAAQAPSIVTQPQGATVSEGNSVTLSAQATGTPGLQYQWLRNGSAISGATGSIYIHSADASDNGAQYSVQVSNAQGSITSNNATLTVTPFAGVGLTNAATAPTIDGNGSDGVWSTATSYPLSHVTSTPGSGFGASLQGAWDNNNLYLLVKVQDANYANSTDNVEVYLDGNNYKVPDAYVEGDWQYIFAWGSTTVSQFQGGRTGNDVVGHSTAGIQFAQVANSDNSGYQTEIQIPWSTLGITAAQGEDIGFDVDVARQDTPGTTTGKVFYNATSDDDWHNSALFGVAQMQGQGGGTPTPTPSPTATATPSPTPSPTPTPGSLPAPWQDSDIGSVGQAGAATFATGVFSVKGSGSDIWDGSDAFNYVYQTLSGDGTIVARVGSQQDTNSWAKAGVMIRETLNASSTFADMVITPLNGAAFQYRSTTGGSATHINGPNVVAPYWVKLVRSGSTLTGYVSSDGVSWTEVGSTIISMASNVYIGLAVTAHNNTALSTATFDNVSSSGGVTVTPTPTPSPTATPSPTPSPSPTGTTGNGSLLASEPFAYANGSLNGLNGGTGWSGAWNTQNSDTAVPGYAVSDATPLSYSGLQSSGSTGTGGSSYLTTGRSLDVSASGPFSSYLSGGQIGAPGTTLWMSLLLRKDAASEQEVSVNLHNNSIGWCTNCASSVLSVGYFGTPSDTGGTRYWGLRINGTVTQSNVPVTVGQATLLVLRIDFGSTTTLGLYANPTSLGGSTPSATNAQATTTSNSVFESIAYYGGDGSGQSSIDELRFGTSYATVTP